MWGSKPYDKELEINQRDRIIRFQKLFNTEDGKAVLRDLMDSFHILNSHKGDAYSEGQRSVVLFVLNQTNQSLKLFDELMKEESA